VLSSELSDPQPRQNPPARQPEMSWLRRKRLRKWAREGCKGFSSKALSPAKMYLLRGRGEYLIHESIDTMTLWINLGADEEGEGAAISARLSAIASDSAR
jgi:hypothetical protein